ATHERDDLPVESPIERALGIRGVRAECSRSDTCRKVVPEPWMLPSDPLDCRTELMRNPAPGTFGRRAGRAITSTKADSGRELLGQGVDFTTISLRAPDIMVTFRLFEVLAQFREPAAIECLGRAVEHGEVRRRQHAAQLRRRRCGARGLPEQV